MKIQNLKIAIVGLGYVGLPLAVAFGKVRDVVGFDVNSTRVTQLKNMLDTTLEISEEELSGAKFLTITDNKEALLDANCFIITVPTPISHLKRPDLSNLIEASELVGKVLKKGSLVIYESTVYPGVTEDICAPILENMSQLKFNIDFFCGYSPERINPGDKSHKLANITKITSGSTLEAGYLVDSLYKQIITAGTFLTASIKIAEAAKVIENTQRDLNIALINELAIIFNKMDISTEAVLEAAETKWNFLSFRPGLVGGHCIGIDPYYLTYKAEELGYYPQVILAGRRLNEGMSSYVAAQLVKAMINKSIDIKEAKILIMGLTFKENCPDLRNSRVVDIIKELNQYKCVVDIYDPWVSEINAKSEYGLKLIEDISVLPKSYYDAVVVTVAHDNFKKIGLGCIRSLCKLDHVIYDIKSIFPAEEVDLQL